MAPYHWLSLVTCAGHLALAVLALARSSARAPGTVLALLAVDLFTWNLADVAADHAASALWDHVDYLASSLTMPLAFHFVLLFLASARRYRAYVVASYVYFGVVGIASAVVPGFGGSPAWAVSLVAVVIVEVIVLLVLARRHLARTRSEIEQARTRLVVLAIGLGVVLGATDLVRILELPVPRLSNVGTLGAVLLLGVGALRFSLFEEKLSLFHALSAGAMGTILVVAYLVVFARFGSNLAMLVLGTTVLTVLTFLAARRFVLQAAEHKKRLDYHATLGRFADQMAHDLRNPMAAAKGAIQFLAQEVREGRSIDDRVEFLELIEAQVARVERVTAQYQRLGRVEPLRSELDVDELVERVVAGMRQATDRVELRLELCRALPPISADRDLLTGVLENLVRNALEAVEGSGVVTVRTGLDGDRVVLAVSDTGRGMSPRLLEQATDAFFTTKATGSGLGLAFARRVAEAHSGVLVIESDEGRGTTVTVALPIDEGRGRDG